MSPEPFVNVEIEAGGRGPASEITIHISTSDGSLLSPQMVLDAIADCLLVECGPFLTSGEYDA